MNTSRMAFSFIILGLPLWFTSLTSHFTSFEPLTLDVEIIGAEDKICQGDSITLEAVVGNGEGPFTYNWFPNEDLSGDPIGNGSTLTVAPDSNQVYCVEVLSADDRGKDNVIVGVKPLPTIKIIDLYCDPGPAPNTYKVKFRSVNENIVLSPPGDYTVTRDGSFDYLVEGIPSGDSLTIRAEFTSTGCSREVTVGFECPDCFVDVDVMALDTAVCLGASTTLTAKAEGGDGPIFIQWFDNAELTGDVLGTDSVLTVTPSEPTAYYAKASFICEDTILVATDSINIGILPSPTLMVTDTICQPGQPTYCLTFNTDADEVDFNLGALEQPQTGESYTICGIPFDETLKITVTNSATQCSRDLELTLAEQDCPSLCPPINVDISGELTVCLGSSTTLTATASGASTGLWCTLQWDRS